MEPEADARSRKLSKKRKNALTRPETVPSQGPKRPLGVREPPRQPNRPGNPPNPEPEPGALACCLGRNQREGFPSRQFWVKPDRLLGLDRCPEVKTLRGKIKLLGQDVQRVRNWQSSLAAGWLEEDPEVCATLCVDGHVKI